MSRAHSDDRGGMSVGTKKNVVKIHHVFWMSFDNLGH